MVLIRLIMKNVLDTKNLTKLDQNTFRMSKTHIKMNNLEHHGINDEILNKVLKTRYYNAV